MTIEGTGNGGVLLCLSPLDVRVMLQKWDGDSEALPLLLPGDQAQLAREIIRASNEQRSQFVTGESLTTAVSEPARCTFESTIEQPSGTIRITATVEIG